MECCKSVNNTPFPVISHTYLPRLGFSSSLRLPGLQSEQYVNTRRSIQPLTLTVSANAESTSCVSAPYKPTSPEGKLLNHVLQNKRYFFQSAVSEKLNELASIREGAAAINLKRYASLESSLHRRIAETKEKERQTAVEDLMYMSIVHKFSEVDIPMVPRLSKRVSNNTVEIWPSKRRELESIHKVEVQKLIREHLATVLPHSRGKSRMIKVHLGRIYAASIMYGYFLKSASFRCNMDSSPACSENEFRPVAPEYSCQIQILAQLGQCTETLVTSLCPESNRSDRLSNYVKGFDSECFQRCAKLKSIEAANVIERHTWAIFGDDKILELGCDREVLIPCSSVERLMLEAVAFGSFLWEVEKSVDSVYTLQTN